MDFGNKLPILATALLICIQFNSRVSAMGGYLYHIEDNIYPVFARNFDDTPVISRKSSVVLFTHSFRPNDLEFVLKYTNLARRLNKWSRILVFEFIDCALEGNIAKCSEINHTPVLQFYPVRDSKAVRGSPTRLDSKGNVDNLISQVVNLLEKTHSGGIFQPFFGLLKFDDPISGLFLGRPKWNHMALLPQTIGSDICREIILGLLPIHEVAVRIVPDKRWFKKNRVEFGDDSIVIVSKGYFSGLKPKALSSQGYIDAITEFLNGKFYYARDFELSEKNYVDIPALQQSIIFSELQKPKTRVYRADLEKAIEKILTQDTLKENYLEGKKLLVLKNIVTLLHHFNPLSATGNGTLIINRFYESLADPKQNKTLGSKVGREQFEKLIGNNSFEAKNYVRCASSIPNLRGFTCALWLLFHYLTVEVANNLGKVKPDSVLWAFHGYANYFLDKPEYYLKLKEYEKKNPIRPTRSTNPDVDVAENDARHSILWLWEVHNHFNIFVPLKEKVDPLFPKIKFPSEKDCPQCQQPSRDGVLNYLKKIYRLKNLSEFGMP